MRPVVGRVLPAAWLLLASSVSRPAEADVPMPLRVTIELHAGALSIATGAGLGLLLAGTEDDCWSSCKGAWAMVGGAVGAAAVPFATFGVARLLGGQGDLGPAVIGFLAGMQLDALLSAVIHKLVGTDPQDVPTFAWLLAATVAIAAPLAGAAAGAEW
jgi:hypothetical protein